MIWKIKPEAPKEFIKSFPEYSPLVLQLLFDRNLKTQKQIDEFFNPDYEADLHDPFLMKGVKEAVLRIKKALTKKEKILIYGDYDADGISGSVILESVLRKIGFKDVGVYIPDRSREGYGLNEEAVREIAKGDCDLIITVDCGISNYEEIKLAKSLGLEVIITDHHLCPKKLPPAKIIINPHQPEDTYPFLSLAGAGVAFKLAQALLRKNKQLSYDGFEKWFLDLVSLATVADCMPLLGENRTLVKYGLVVLAQTQRLGLQELMKVARVNGSLEVIENGNGQVEHKVAGLDSWTFAFSLAPRINVAARLSSVDTAYRLLSTESQEEAQQLAQKLEELNRQRQQMVNKIIRDIDKRISQKELPKVIFEEDSGWSPGILGLIAGKIAEKYNRPTFILNSEDELLKGSIRSIANFDLVAAISKCQDLLISFGGHAAAAGLKIEKKNFKKFKKRFTEIAEEKISPEDLIPKLEVDCQLSLKDFDWAIYDQIQKFAPFGKANPEPKFILRDLEIVALDVIGSTGKHLRLDLFGPLDKENHQMKKIQAIGFGLSDWDEKLKLGDKIEVVGEFIADQWNGTRNLKLKIIDLKKI